MALIKCNECGQKISDKATTCIHCGCPIEKKLVCNECGKKINSGDKICKNCGCPIKNNENVFSKIWLILCVIICFGISIINIFNIFNIQTSPIIIDKLHINVMGILALILGVSYIILLKKFTKKYFYLLLGINVIILIYNIILLQTIINLFYIMCVIFNSLITFFVVRKKLKSDVFSFKTYLPVFITFIVTIILVLVLILLSVNKTIDIRSNDRNYNTPQIEIIAEYINIREEKDINSNILGKVYYGDIYDIISEDEESFYDWYEIETSNGIRGFIAGKNNDVDYVRKLEVNGLLSPEEETHTEPSVDSSNNTSNNSINSPSNSYNTSSNSNTNNYTPTPTPVNYNITSISGIGNTYNYRGYNECRVDNFTASVKEISLENHLQVDYAITMTKTKKFYDNYDSFCRVNLYVYDDSNVVVGSHSAFVDIGLNETGRETFWFYIDKSGTNYTIKISEDN